MRGSTPSADPEPGQVAWEGRAVLPIESGATWVDVDAYAAPPPRRRTGVTVFMFGALFFLLVGASGATLAFIVHTGRSSSTSTIGAAPPGLGAVAQDGRFTFVVSSVSCGHDGVHQGPLSKAPHGQYCLVALDVANTGKQSQTFAEAYQRAVGPTGAVYPTDSGAGVLANPDGTGTWRLISPGAHVSGTIVFDIPKDAVIAQLELHDSPFSRGVRIVAR